jgi:molybdopterin-containing oxidoreductase family membrane subunit
VSQLDVSLDKDRALVRPILETGPRFYFAVVALAAVTAFGGYAYLTQYRLGLGVTGLNRPVFWGIYITNFVFFIGISHAGTLISAILRIAQAEWRRSITRSAEVITVVVLMFGVGNILIDMGRPDRLMNVIEHGQLRSPLLWDVCSVTLYLTGSILYLYMPLIPDVAILRDNTTKHRWLYTVLALGWRGTPRQWKALERGISIMAIVIIPIAVSVHTVVSFVFAMTVQPMWHSAIFGPYFVVGAIFSGIAALILAMALIRWAYGLENYMKEIQFNYLGMLLLIMSLLWFYFTASEFVTTFYGSEPSHMSVFWEKWNGRYSGEFWTMFVCCFIVPVAILSNRRTRTVLGCSIASITVVIGMWLERWIIVVPTLSNPRMAIPRGDYTPSWVEWSIMAGCFACFTLLYMTFTKFFPVISIWEIAEGRQRGVKEVLERVESYLPTDVDVPEHEGPRAESAPAEADPEVAASEDLAEVGT